MMENTIHCRFDEMVDTRKLRNHPKNPNKHGDDQIERLAKLYKYHGIRHPIIVSSLSGYIVAGHGRKLAALRAGIAQMPIVIQDFATADDEYAFLVSDNAISEWSDLNLSEINTEFINLGPDFDKDMLGIKNFLIEPADRGEESQEPKDRDRPKVKKGQVWILGSHRLYVGDDVKTADDVEAMLTEWEKFTGVDAVLQKKKN